MNPCPKPTRWKSVKYINWIKQQSCIQCGSPAEPHHLKGIGGMSGGSLKAPDWAVSPLCHPCHDEMHRKPELWPQQWGWIAKTLGQAIEEGVLS